MRSCSGADANHVLDQRGGDQHRAVVVHDNKIVGIDGDAAAADRLLPIDKGESGHRGRGGCARAPDVEAGLENARDVAHGPVGDEAGHAALLHPRAQDVAEDSGIGDAHRVGDHNAAGWRLLDRRSRRARRGPRSRSGEILARGNEAQGECASDYARLPGTNWARPSHPNPPQSMLEQNCRDCRCRHGFQRIDDVA